MTHTWKEFRKDLTMTAIRNIVLILVVVLSSSPPFSAADKPWTMDALMALKSISDPQISPDGSKVAYVVRSANFQRKAYDSQIWVVSTSRGKPQPLKSSHFSDSRPRWSQQGNRLAFVSRRDGSSQIYILAAPDGEPKKLTASPSGVGDFKWSPDDSHIACLAVDALSPEDKKRIQDGDDPIVANQGYRYSRLCQISTKGGLEQRLTASDRHVTSFDWAPDGKKLVYSAQATPRNRDTFHADLYEVDRATGRETPLVAQEGRDAEPSYSPDGRWIAFHSQAGKINYFEERHVGLVPSGGGEIRYLTRNLAADVFRGGNEFWWTKDGSELTFGAGAGTQDHLFTVRLKDGTSSKWIESLAGPSSFSISANGQQVAFLKSSSSAPPQLYLAAKAGAQWKETVLVSLNAEIAELPRVAAKTLRWKSRDGLEVEGVLRLPYGYQQGKRVPLLVELHGGPTGVALEGFPTSRTYPYQLFLQEGFAVLAPNFRGSSNYGGKFRLANIESQGFGDFDDVMTGIDALIQQGIADPDRLGVMGWSYGGFLSAWILGHSDRFKAISIGAPGADWISWYSRSDGPREVMWTYFGGKPWDHWESYNRHAPRYSLRYAKTPSLLLHGEEDIDDVAEIFQALTDLNVPVEFVTYPREGHGITEPAHQRDMMRRNLEWFKRWVLKE
jgi:dipeptidyl aminopeptidase/acylaminoacyl peptidase